MGGRSPGLVEPSAEPGPWRTARAPFLRAIMDALGPDDPHETVVLMKGSQIGATECGAQLPRLRIEHVGGVILLVMPSLADITRNTRVRIDPMIEACADPRRARRVAALAKRSEHHHREELPGRPALHDRRQLGARRSPRRRSGSSSPTRSTVGRSSFPAKAIRSRSSTSAPSPFAARKFFVASLANEKGKGPLGALVDDCDRITWPLLRRSRHGWARDSRRVRHRLSRHRTAGVRPQPASRRDSPV